MPGNGFLGVGSDFLVVGNRFLAPGNDFLVPGNRFLAVGNDFLGVVNHFLAVADHVLPPAHDFLALPIQIKVQVVKEGIRPQANRQEAKVQDQEKYRNLLNPLAPLNLNPNTRNPHTH